MMRAHEDVAVGISKHLRAIALLPGMVLGVIPTSLQWFGGLDSIHHWKNFPASKKILLPIGITYMCLGLFLMVATIKLFATVGQGTLAPWQPTRRLVVQGVYRHVRNPMISGVLFVLLGESALTASVPLFRWFLIFAVINAIYIPLLEEPMLVNRFGDLYMAYKRHVPRWIPRWKPWDGESGHVMTER
jgi:protein-S-isoprenylcysteine O-methyltransferase Ste14